MLILMWSIMPTKLYNPLGLFIFIFVSVLFAVCYTIYLKINVVNKEV